MAALYVLGGIVLVGIGALIFFRQKWGRADRAEARGRAEKIEEEKSKE